MRVLLIAMALAACSQPEEAKTAPPAATAEAPAPPAQPQTPQQALTAMPSWENARAAGVDFRAVGQEPGWLLDLYTRGIAKLAWDYGEQYNEFAIVEPTHPQEGVTRYEAHSDGVALIVTIRRGPCADAMSGESFPSRVQITIDGRVLEGCGRSV